MSVWKKLVGSVVFVAMVGVAFAFVVIWFQSGSAPPSESAKANWQVDCRGPQGSLNCVATQSLYGKTTGRRLLSAGVRVAPETKQPVLLLRLPLGVYLPGGILLRIGDQPEKRLAVETCTENGCAAKTAVTKDEIAALLRGANLVVSVRDEKRKTVTFQILGGGFDKAYTRLN